MSLLNDAMQSAADHHLAESVLKRAQVVEAAARTRRDDLLGRLSALMTVLLGDGLPYEVEEIQKISQVNHPHELWEVVVRTKLGNFGRGLKMKVALSPAQIEELEKLHKQIQVLRSDVRITE